MHKSKLGAMQKSAPHNLGINYLIYRILVSWATCLGICNIPSSSSRLEE